MIHLAGQVRCYWQVALSQPISWAKGFSQPGWDKYVLPSSGAQRIQRFQFPMQVPHNRKCLPSKSKALNNHLKGQGLMPPSLWLGTMKIVPCMFLTLKRKDEGAPTKFLSLKNTWLQVNGPRFPTCQTSYLHDSIEYILLEYPKLSVLSYCGQFGDGTDFGLRHCFFFGFRVPISTVTLCTGFPVLF